MLIWDLHCHFSGAVGDTPEQRMAYLMQFADRMGVDRLVFFMGWGWARDPTPQQLTQQNDYVLQAISHWHDRAFGFCYVSGNHPEASIREIDRCVRDGPMTGIKLWTARRCNTPEVEAIVRHAARFKAVIFQHAWFNALEPEPTASTPDDVAELAVKMPAIPIICGHIGGDWELGIRSVRGLKDVSAGIGGSDPTAGFVEMAVREMGADHVIYGSDIGGRSFSSQLAKVTGARISEDAKRLILAENLKRMMMPILRDKGIAV